MRMFHKESSKSIDSPIKVNRHQDKNVDKKSKISVYSAGLRQFDEKVRKEKVVKRKYRNCVSE